ncbi:hypothetical protein ACFL6S_16865 [Candidatus Poribacteria bacterium]
MLRKILCICAMVLATVMFSAVSSFGQMGEEWPDIIFTEDFEGDELQGWQVSGNLEIQPDNAHEGQAAKFGPVDDNQAAEIRRHDILSDANQFYIVFWVMQTKPEDNAFTLYLSTGGEARENPDCLNFKVLQGMLSPVAEGWGDPNAVMGIGIDVPIQADKWHQIGVAMDYAKGSYELYFDDLDTPIVKDIPYRDRGDRTWLLDEDIYFVVWNDEPHEGLAYLDDFVFGLGPMPSIAVSPREKAATTWGDLKASR